ncbi:GroES-like protein [Periconia macrospinosa]|uniref:GroES-like protein n=1 Tax=Periconia macrospinosa TaxID=97972 RepID=A0A2V1D0A1_9PLEO|nr:GroES-like protein [Periconia macrospinosa]
MSSPIPTHHRALVLKDVGSPLHLSTLPTPHATHGSAIVRIEAASVLSYHGEIYSGVRAYHFPTPLVGGFSAIGRIASIGPDATALSPGQLVYVDCTIRARDDPDTQFLSAIHDSGAPGSVKLMRDVWRDGNFAEYANVPLENCIKLNEGRLCGDLGYEVQDLMHVDFLLTAYGGLRDIRLEAGETVVVCPATGNFGGAGVQVAVSMGARVIAMGRNMTELRRLKDFVRAGSPGAEIETVGITGDEKADTEALSAFGTIDAVLDFTPPQGIKSTHLRSATSMLRRNGRVSMMGFSESPVAPWAMVSKSIRLQGKLMYEREDMVQFFKMLEAGRFAVGKQFVDTKAFELGDWKAAFDTAAEHTGIGRHVVLKP